MKLFVKVIAISEENGLKATREELVEIPVKVQRLNEVVMGKDPAALLDGFATSAMVAALQTVQVGGQNRAADILTGVGSGPIGGHTPPPAPGPDGAPAQAAPKDPLAEALGLDIIEAMDQREQRTHGPAYPRGYQAPPQPAQPAPRVGGLQWGPIGYGPDRTR